MNELSTDDAARAAALEQRITQLEDAHRRRVIEIEVRAEALRQGLIDLDALKLADLSRLEMSDEGEVKGVSSFLREFRARKPYLFSAATTSSTAATPNVDAPRGRTAMQMSHDEWQAARAELVRRR